MASISRDLFVTALRGPLGDALLQFALELYDKMPEVSTEIEMTILDASDRGEAVAALEAIKGVCERRPGKDAAKLAEEVLALMPSKAMRN